MGKRQIKNQLGVMVIAITISYTFVYIYEKGITMKPLCCLWQAGEASDTKLTGVSTALLAL